MCSMITRKHPQKAGNQERDSTVQQIDGIEGTAVTVRVLVLLRSSPVTVAVLNR